MSRRYSRNGPIPHRAPPRIRHPDDLCHLKSEIYPVESTIYGVFCRTLARRRKVSETCMTPRTLRLFLSVVVVRAPSRTGFGNPRVEAVERRVTSAHDPEVVSLERGKCLLECREFEFPFNEFSLERGEFRPFPVELAFLWALRSRQLHRHQPSLASLHCWRLLCRSTMGLRRPTIGCRTRRLCVSCASAAALPAAGVQVPLIAGRHP